MSLTCGIDVGTQSTKVIVFDSEKKEIISSSSYNYEMTSREDGTREQDAYLFIKAVKSCFSQLDSSLKKNIKAIGVSGQQHGLVALDKNGVPLVKVKLWCDTSTASQCRKLTEKLGGEKKVFSLIQNQIKTGYTAGKVLYLKENNKEAYSEMAHILLPHDWINFYLTGNYTMEAGDASGTGFFNVEKKEWSNEVLNAIDSQRDLKKCLPQILKCTQQSGTLQKSTAEELGLQIGTVVSCGGGDNMMAAIGTGCTKSGDIVMSMGTSGTLFGYSNTAVSDEKDRIACFASSSGGYLPLLCTMNCTVISEKIRLLLGMSLKDFDQKASEGKPGSSGIIILPYLNGERTPNYPRGEGVIGGLNTANLNRENIARAALEAAVFGMKIGMNAFLEQGFKPKRIILTGGGANSSVWPQIVSDIFQMEVDIPNIKESAAFGGALQALALIHKESIEETAQKYVSFRSENCFMPDNTKTEFYEKAYKKYKKYDSHLCEMFK